MPDFLMKPKIDFAFKEIMEDENIISPMRWTRQVKWVT